MGSIQYVRIYIWGKYSSPLLPSLLTRGTHTLTQLAIQLNYVYNQILSVLTNTQLSQIFEKKPGYDLRYLLQGSEKFVDNILNMIDKDPSFTIGGVSTRNYYIYYTCIYWYCKILEIIIHVYIIDKYCKIAPNDAHF